MDIKTKEDLIIDWNEIEAYRRLSGEPFDFGTGLITDDSSESEDAYWKIEQWDIEKALDDKEDVYLYRSKRKRKYKLNRYNRKFIDRVKLKKLSNRAYTIYFNEEKGIYTRFYLSGCKQYAKWCSDRAVRNRNDFPLRGAGYRKVYDYWWCCVF